MAALLLVGLAASRQGGDRRWIDRLVMGVERHRYALAAALWIALALGTRVVYRSHPLSLDEYTAWFQAEIFAAGALHGQFPPDLLDRLVPQAFQNYFLLVDRHSGAVASAYWPGFSLLLAPFVLVGMPWACNPTLVALSFLLVGRLARDVLREPGAAGWAMLFALASPAFVVNGISFYAMPAHLLFSLLFAWLLISPSPRRVVLAGLAGSYALVLHNPLPHLLFALPWIVWLVTRRGSGLRNAGWLLLGYLPIVLCLGLGWLLWRQNFHASLPAATAAAAVAATAPLPAIEWPALRSAANLVLALAGVLDPPDRGIVLARFGGLAKLWLWSSPVLLLLAWLGGRRQSDPALRLLGASALVMFFAYFLVPFDQGHGWGYRYFHPAFGVLPVLAACAMLRWRDEPQAAGALRGLAVAVVASLVLMNGLRAWQIGDFVQDHLAQMPPGREDRRQVLFLRGEGYYALDLIQNDPWLRGRTVILLKGTDEADEAIARRFLPGGYTVERNRFGTGYVAR